MKSIADTLKKREIKKAPHELSAITNEIERVIGFTPRYNRGYWLKKCKGKSFGEIMGLLKQAEGMDKKYNKGGFITNALKENSNQNGN